MAVQSITAGGQVGIRLQQLIKQRLDKTVGPKAGALAAACWICSVAQLELIICWEAVEAEMWGHHSKVVGLQKH